MPQTTIILLETLRSWRNLSQTLEPSNQPLPRPAAAAAAAAFFLALDAFICVGPPKALIHRIFLADADVHRNTKKARRLVSQLAARVVGCLFLALMFPEAFATLRDKTLQADKIYAHSPTSEACIALAAGNAGGRQYQMWQPEPGEHTALPCPVCACQHLNPAAAATGASSPPGAALRCPHRLVPSVRPGPTCTVAACRKDRKLARPVGRLLCVRCLHLHAAL